MKNNYRYKEISRIITNLPTRIYLTTHKKCFLDFKICLVMYTIYGPNVMMISGYIFFNLMLEIFYNVKF